MLNPFVLFVAFAFGFCEVLGDTENIFIKLGDPAYEKIHYPLNSLPKNIEKTWIFTTDSNGKISFTCREFRISIRQVCRGEELLIDIGGREKRYCGTQTDVEVRSRQNKMIIKLKTSDQDGHFDCLVQAISGYDVDEYKNIESTELDSSEFGVKKGVKSTTCPCGWSNKNMARIINGNQAGKHEFPWMAAVRRVDGEQFCGGAVISEYHVLTAAHCTVNKHDTPLEIMVGSFIRWASLEGQRIKVKKIIEQEYNPKKAHENDMAILLLEEKINFNENVGPICLTPNHPTINNKYITVMGWGYQHEQGYDQPDYLRKANVRVVDINTCSYKYTRRFDPKIQNRICTWSSNRDSCMGDSGGPLVWLDPETNRYTQVGLVSFGKGCNTPNPKVNTAVTHYYEWIKQVVEDTSPGAKVCRKI